MTRSEIRHALVGLEPKPTEEARFSRRQVCRKILPAGFRLCLTGAWQRQDTFEAFRSSIFSGRLPAFTVMEGAAGKQIQLAHLSFQELLAAEFATAVLQHSHKTCHVAPYWNFLSSSSVSCQSRDRLAEQWWLTVWINVSEMLGEDCFQAWCKEVGSDERALLKTGRICLHPNQMYFAGDDAYPQASVPHLVKSYRVTWIDSRAKLLKMEETKLKKQRQNYAAMERKGETASMLSELMPLEAAHWICEGVGTLACFAVDHKQWSLVKALLAAGTWQHKGDISVCLETAE